MEKFNQMEDLKNLKRNSTEISENNSENKTNLEPIYFSKEELDQFKSIEKYAKSHDMLETIDSLDVSFFKNPYISKNEIIERIKMELEDVYKIRSETFLTDIEEVYPPRYNVRLSVEKEIALKIFNETGQFPVSTYYHPSGDSIKDVTGNTIVYIYKDPGTSIHETHWLRGKPFDIKALPNPTEEDFLTLEKIFRKNSENLSTGDFSFTGPYEMIETEIILPKGFYYTPESPFDNDEYDTYFLSLRDGDSIDDIKYLTGEYTVEYPASRLDKIVKKTIEGTQTINDQPLYKIEYSFKNFGKDLDFKPFKPRKKLWEEHGATTFEMEDGTHLCVSYNQE